MTRRLSARPRASTRLVPLPGPLEVRLLPSADVLTYHGDNSRSGWDSDETALTPADVNSSTFGELFNKPVDGNVDAQPLYEAGVVIPGQGVHNVLYVATENDSVYAFDADNGLPLWHVSLVPAGEVPSGTPQTSFEVGITATPAIDAVSGTMYVVAETQSVSGGTTVDHIRLHALSVTTGADLVPARTIDQSITYPGSGPGGNGTSVIFDPNQYRERDALLISGGIVYTSWSSHYDTAPYTGWVIGYREGDLGLASVLNIDPAGQPTSSFLDDGSGNSFWNSDGGPAADAQGNLYNISANGPFDTSLNAAGFPTNGDYGDSFLKLTPSAGGLSVADYFTPAAEAVDAEEDFDLGSSGIALLDVNGPGGAIEHLAIGSDKLGDIYVVNRDDMGKYNASGDAIVQELPLALGGGEFGTPAVFGGVVYFGGVGQPIRAFVFVNGLLVPAAVTGTTFTYPGSTPTVSSDGGADGILWATENTTNAVLHAYLASNPSVEIYNSNMAPNGRDWFGVGNKFITPTVANGKVYVGTTSGVAAFGLLLTPPPIFAQPPRAASSPVVGDSVALSVGATDASYPASALIYYWGTISAPAGSGTPTFSDNYDNSSRSTVATVTAPGTYLFLVTVADPSGNQSNCLTVVQVVAGASSSASPAIASAVVVAPPQAASTTPGQAAPSAPVAKPVAVAVTGLALAPTTPAAATMPGTVTPSAPATQGVGRIMLVPQELPEAANPAIYPLGERRPFARSTARWWSS